MTKPKAPAKGKTQQKKKLTPKAKDTLLTKAHTRSMEMMFAERSLDKVNETVADDVMGYGTTLDEKMFGIGGYLELVRRQREQGADIEMKITQHPVFRRVSAATDSAVIVEEIDIDLLIAGEHHNLHVRLTTIYEFVDDKWKLIHWHGSKPEYESGGADTWHIGEWENKTAELERQVEEKTHDLSHKNRALEVEAALEKVRSASLAMHSSSDLGKVAGVLFDKLMELGLSFDGALIFLFDRERKNIDLWIATTQLAEATLIDLPFDEVIINNEIMVDLWKAINDGEHIINRSYSGAAKNDYFQYVCKHNQSKIPASVGELQQNAGSWTGTFAAEKNCLLGFDSWTGRITPAADVEILKRFAGVFEQAYVRFLDLQKAEAQAREALIESALERVRGKAMAMHTSSDLKDVVRELRKQLNTLGQRDLETFVIHLHDESPDHIHAWAAVRPATSDGEILEVDILVPKRGLEIIEEALDQYDAKRGDYMLVHDGKKASEWMRFIEQASSATIDRIMESRDNSLPMDLRGYWSFSDFDGGSLLMATLEPPPDASRSLLRRFANVFGLAYRRFADLRQAESQAHEAKIEAALERVRARTMAMHKSGELAEAAHVLFQQLVALGGIPDRISICIVDDDERAITFWITDQSGLEIKRNFKSRLDEPTTISKAFTAWKAGKPSLIVDLQGAELDAWLEFVIVEVGIQVDRKFIKNRRVHQFAYFTHGWLMVSTHEPCTDETMRTLERFALVFNLTYRRFLDLKMAEGQAKEAQIEAALERVRGKAMAMHNSSDLATTAGLVFGELRKLGINPIRCGIGLIDQSMLRALLYAATSSAGNDTLSVVGSVLLSSHPVLTEIFEHWRDKTDFFPDLSGNELVSYYEKLLEGLPVPVPQFGPDEHQHGHFIPFSVGCLYAWSGTPYQESDVKILKRFAAIVDLTFRRYSELQKSEASAREAIKQAALDRIRADIASMRNVADLDRITPLIWNELTTLGVPFIRCGVFIMDQKEKQVHTFLSTPEGKAITAFHIPFDVPGNIGEALRHWEMQTPYAGRWSQDDFNTLADILIKQGTIDNREQYLNSLPAGGFWLHFLPFLQGMLYVGNTDKLGDEHISLIQSIASAFSTAYARYEDFKKLQLAKVQVENTLSELKQAQQQLVQSEKMASLGELTAGIAHEIQNPLNFVNNFSELNNELINEMVDEIGKGNFNDVRDLARSIGENQEKINYHGKRAEGIVKGMLQHSRTSSGQKELTDLNSLSDEYLRLAYHGMRAKDKSFNANFETDFDPSLPKVNLVPQDIGRVILNLINNAFYAVAEKKKMQQGDYSPMVKIVTKKISDTGVELHISDNGDGIPAKIMDKVFQPFFTTKPTGQGTGLGLSLSYDIIKSHQGEIKIETEQGQGTKFVISL
ncbi:ATP-binding protein [Chryseolinea sp. T2]|uniref:ATP-binding protein n=1 Tax=Chryseolinea sp. T2 TaxID=3129255 RepID=UPI003076D7D1